MPKPDLSQSVPAYVFVTEASAGSGKTYCLAKRYLSLLIDPASEPGEIPLNTILAITFTNKASREMKERILNLLRQLAFDEFSDPKQKKDILKTLNMEGRDKEAGARAKRLMDYIIANYNFFQVKTIDSFINMILLGSAYQVGLSSNFAIRDDRQDYLALSLDDCIERAAASSAKSIFNNFIEQYLYLEGRNSWLPKKDILDLLNAMFFHVNVYGSSFNKFDLEGLDIVKEKRGLLNDYRKLLQKAPEGMNGTFRNSLNEFVQNNEEAFDFKDAAKKNFLADELPMNKDKKAPDEVEKLWKRLRRDLIGLCEKEARSYFNCYIDIFNLVYAAFRDYAMKDDVLFLEELNQQAKSLIRQNGLTVPELYYHIATRLRHYLVDEFQDTSVLQWQNLYPMVEEAISTGGTFFYVGDKKQAIFRFRGGEVGLSELIKEEYLKMAKVESLDKNYRSCREIIEFNNQVFSQDNLKRFIIAQQEAVKNDLKKFSESDIKDILTVFACPQQKQEKEGSGLVTVQSVQCLDRDDLDQQIRERVLSLVQEIINSGRFRARDIAILCRDNKEVELVSGWLIELRIPVESEKTLNIRNNKYIKELLCLLKFLNSPIDNLSFASFILGDVFIEASGLPREEMEGFLFGLKEKLYRQEGFYIYREFRRKYPKLWEEFLKVSFEEVGFISLYEFMADILSTYRVLANFPDQQGFFMHFLQLIKECEEEYPGVTDFLQHLDELDDARLFVDSSGADAVKVMTVHKAKGLGFEAVIIPFLNLDINDLGSQTKRGRAYYSVEETDDGLALLLLDQKYAFISPEIRAQYMNEYKKAFQDELNIIYVSLTRAKSELHIMAPYGLPRTNNAARFLIPESLASAGHAQAGKRPEKEQAVTLVIPKAQYQKWNEFLKEEFSDERILRKRAGLLFGKICHAMLAAVGNLAQTGKEEALRQGLERARAEFGAVSDFSEQEALVRKVLCAKPLEKYFSVPGAMVFQEKEVVDNKGRTKRIDRLIVKDKEVWIVDYKTKAEPELDYKKQVDEYRSIIRELYPRHEIKGYLIYLEELKVEDVS